MTDWGHVNLSRKFFEEDFWWNEPRPRTKAEAWIDLIQMAAWKPFLFTARGMSEHLDRGEFTTSIRFLADRWRWGKGKVEKFLEVAQKRGRIRGQRRGQFGTVYLIINYDFYQGDRRSGGQRRGQGRGRREDKEETIQDITTISTLPPPILPVAPNGANGSHPPTARPANWVAEAVEIYAAHIGLYPHGRVGTLLKPIVARRGWPEVRAVLECFCELAPYEEYLTRMEAGLLRPGEEKAKRFGYHTKLEAFVERYTHWQRHLEPAS